MSAALEMGTRKSLSVLIVQLGEMEEVFRSLMALKAVKHLYPEIRFRFMVRSQCKTPLFHLDWIESIHEIPSVVGSDPLKVVAQWVDQVIDQPCDLLFNWTFSRYHSRMAAILTTLIPAAVKFGNYFRNDSHLGSHDAWSIYREAWLRDPSLDQDIHHTDIITTQLLTALQIHSGDPSGDVATASVTSRNFFGISPRADLPDTAKKWIAVHPDSLDLRFEEVMEMILRRHPEWGIILLNDQPLISANESFHQHPRIVNLSGQLNFELLVSALSRCSWLITGHAPIADLANLLNLRTLFWIESKPEITGESRYKWTETGPYGNGNIAVRFVEDFEPEVIYAIWSHVQSEWYHQGKITLDQHFQNLGVVSKTEGLELYRSRIRSPEEGGGVSFESMIETETRFDEWMFRLRGQMARAWFCGWIPSVDEEVARIKLSPELIRRSREIRESIELIEQLCIQGKNTSKDLSRMASRIRNLRLMPAEDHEMIDLQGKKLNEVESLMDRVVKVEPELRCFLSWYQHLMHNLSGETLEQMARESHQAFELISEGAELVHVYLNRILDRAKPKSVTLQSVSSKEISPLEKN